MNKKSLFSGLYPAMMTASERRLGRFLRAPEGHGGDGEGGGSGEGGAGDGDGDGAGSGGGDGAAGAAGALDDGDGSGGGDGKSWYDGLSADAPDEKTLSDADWMKNKNFEDLPALVKSYRNLEAKAARAKGIEVPGEDATDEQVAAFRKAIGAGETAEDYAFDVPDGFEEDMAILGPLRDIALASGTPVPAFKAVAEGYAQVIADQYAAQARAADAERDAVYAEWGAQKDENLTLFKRGMAAFGFDVDKAGRMQAAMGEGGTKFLFDLGLKLGRLSGEDGFVSGDTKSFGIAPEQARSKLAEREKDPAWVKKLADKDPATVAEHERYITVIAQDDERKARQAQAA